LQNSGASAEELSQLLGQGRSRKGMFEGDTEEGELEIGQVSGLIRGIKPAAQIVKEIISEFESAKTALSLISL
jgi:enoyl-[acyl-carrier protein] reductase II